MKSEDRKVKITFIDGTETIYDFEEVAELSLDRMYQKFKGKMVKNIEFI